MAHVPDSASNSEIFGQFASVSRRLDFIEQLAAVGATPEQVDAAVAAYLMTNPPPPGEDGREVELGTNATHVRWRYVGDPAWIDLIALADLKGDPGDPGLDGDDGDPGAPGAPGDPGVDGREVELQQSVTHIQWRYIGDPAWTDLTALADLAGTDGADGH